MTVRAMADSLGVVRKLWRNPRPERGPREAGRPFWRRAQLHVREQQPEPMSERWRYVQPPRLDASDWAAGAVC